MAIAARLAALMPFGRYRVDGESMLPDVSPGERVLVNRLAYRLGKPSTGDLVVLRDPREPSRLLLKRLDAKDGDRWLVAGANAASSTDSRTFGPVAQDALVGKVLFRY